MLAPKSVLITGSNRGIGLELVKRFLKLKIQPKYIFATCRCPEKAEELNNISKQNPSVVIYPLDVTDESSIQKAQSSVASNLGEEGLSLLINNSGRLSHLNYDDVTKEAMMEEYETNTVGPLMVTKAFHTLLKMAADSMSNTEMSCNKAAVINFSSIMASISETTNPSSYPYRASKAALNMVTKCLSLDLKADGIMCVALHPGWIQTDMGTGNAPLTIDQGGQAIFAALERLRGDEFNGALYSAPKLKIIPW